MKLKNPFKTLTKFELILWLMSITTVVACFFLSYFVFDNRGILTILSSIASLIGVTSLIFLAKGYVIGQILIVVFSVFYGIISYFFKYYGEMLTYLCMTTPMAIMAIVSWIKHPFEKTAEVEISTVSKRQVMIMLGLTAIITLVMYFVLAALNTSNIVFSVISVATSFLAVYLTYLRSEYYALAYAGNDIVLIVLWVMASIENPTFIPMIICFFAFLANDLYAFVNWQKIKARQHAIKKSSK